MELFKIFGKIAVDNDNANEALDETTDKAGKTKKGFGNLDSAARTLSSGGFTILKGAASNLVSQGFTKLVSAMEGLISSGVDYSRQIEQYQTSFATMTGSAEKAAEVTARLQEIGAATPFELTNLADTTQLLMNYGFTADDAIEKMTMLGDISQGNSEKMTRIATAYGQMSSAGKVSLEDIKQMIESGFNPLMEISETTGESMESLYERISEGKISVDEITASMERSTAEGGKYFGSMDAQSTTLNGRLSTLSDTANESIGNILGGVLAKAADEWIPKLTEAVGSVDEKFQLFTEKMQPLKEWFQDIGDYITTSFQPVLSDLETAWTTVKDAVQPFIDKLSEYVTSGEASEDITNTLKDAIDILAGAYETVKSSIENVAQGFQDAITWGQEHSDMLTVIAIAVGTLTAAIAAYNVAMAIKKAGGIVEIAQLAATAIGVGALTVAQTAHTVATNIATAATTAFGAVLSFVTSPITLVVLAIGALIAVIVLCVQHWDVISAKVSEVWTNITTWVSEAVASVTATLTSWKETLSTKFEEIKTSVSEKWTAITGAITGAIETVKATTQEKLDAIKTAYEENGGGIQGVVAAAWTGIQEYYTAGYDYINDLTGGKLDEIKDKFTEKLDAAKEIVNNAIEAIKGFFDFEWSLPHITLPHFSIVGSFSLSPLSVPHLSVEWYKEGGVLTDPTAFGINPNNGKLMVGGEAGAEAIAPVDVLQGYVAAAVAGQNAMLVSVLEQILAAILAMDDNMGGNLREALAGTRFSINDREFARLVKAVT